MAFMKKSVLRRADARNEEDARATARPAVLLHRASGALRRIRLRRSRGETIEPAWSSIEDPNRPWRSPPESEFTSSTTLRMEPRVAMFLVAFIVLIMFYEVVMRYFFRAADALGQRDVAVAWAGMVYLLSGLYVMQQRGHIRIFILYDLRAAQAAAAVRRCRRWFCVCSRRRSSGGGFGRPGTS